MKRMGRRTSFVILSMALIAGIGVTLVSCNRSRTLNVRIKAGVVLKSGDVKNVARQDLIITKADIIELWKTSKNETGYDARINSLVESINEKNGLITQLGVEIQHQQADIAKRLYEHLEATFQESKKYLLGSDFADFADHRVEVNDEGFLNIQNVYSRLIKDNPDEGELKQFLWRRFTDFLEIKNSFLHPPAAAKQTGVQTELYLLLRRQKAFADFNKETDEKDRSYFEKAQSDFLIRFKKVFVSVFKTDLNGEANIKIPMGKFYIFCNCEIGLNHITWNYPMTIAKDGQYIELANDNAFSFKEEDTTQLLKVLYEVLAKMGAIQRTPD